MVSLISKSFTAFNLSKISLNVLTEICPPIGWKYTLYNPFCFCEYNLECVNSISLPSLVISLDSTNNLTHYYLTHILNVPYMFL